MAMLAALPSPVNLSVAVAQPIDPAAWVQTADYPPIAVQQAQEGAALVRLHITGEGRVDDCAVVESSGSPLLDLTTCTLVRHRARYRPAADSKGRPVATTDRRRIAWKLPQDGTPGADWVPRAMSVAVKIDVDMDDKGAVAACRSTKTKSNAAELVAILDEMGKNLCAEIGGNEDGNPMRDTRGKAVPSRLTFVISADLRQR
ncbi:TonB family protein [Sphingomonas prati]|uniref:TonB family protein n=2 Tax=Sphingomonas prati TaxID=1843237 RepID=A0A7W9BV13_9SPHN|nr:TonB family protein [Sphingomonas prati]